jgi:hypothetical protein
MPRGKRPWQGLRQNAAIRTHHCCRGTIGRPGQEACAAGFSVVLAEADSCQAQLPASQPTGAIASGASAPDPTAIL